MAVMDATERRAGELRIISNAVPTADLDVCLQMRTTRRQFIAAFDRHAAQLSRQDARFSHLSPYTARRVLAALVYNLANGNCPCYVGVHRMAFCWEVCTAELHDNRRRSVAPRVGNTGKTCCPQHT